MSRQRRVWLLLLGAALHSTTSLGLDLSAQQSSLLGDQPGVKLGSSTDWNGPRMRSDGDLTGDGADDLVVGDPESVAFPGRVSLCPGHWPKWALDASVSGCFSITGENADDQFGAALVILDWDGDGQDDLAVGAPGYDTGTGSNSGRVYIFLGPLLASTSATQAHQVLEGAFGDGAGAVLAVAGNFDSLPGEELAVGAPFSWWADASGGAPASGAVWVIGDSLPGTPADLRAGALVGIWGEETGERLGSALAGDLDVDGDGLEDVWVGADNASGSLGFGQGRILLLRGQASASAPGPASTRASAIVEGQATGAGFGTSLLALGNIDGDLNGRGELLVGEPGFGCGTVDIFRGRADFSSIPTAASADLSLTCPGALAGQDFGKRVALARSFPSGGASVLLSSPLAAGGGRIDLVQLTDLATALGGVPQAVEQLAVDQILGGSTGLETVGIHGSLLGPGLTWGTPVVADPRASAGFVEQGRLVLMGTVDSDGDGCLDGVDPLPGISNPDSQDADGIPDVCDRCFGDDASSDTDGDGTCNDLDGDDDGDGCADGVDPLPTLFSPDGDGDGLGDDCDPCVGFDPTDTDGDGLCDDTDPDDDDDGCADPLDAAPLVWGGGDGDGDGVVDDCDLCLGQDSTGDLDQDGLCNDVDGDDDGDGCDDPQDAAPLVPSVDLDGDAVPDDCDLCAGDNGSGDPDSDGWCGDLDCDETLADLNQDGLPDGFLVNPGQPEIPGNGIDDDCDGVFGEDADGDGVMGSPSGPDCDDTDAAIYPGAVELCDHIDNDCDSLVDEDFDLDGDGYVGLQFNVCTGHTPDEFDCNDASVLTHPGAVEICDGFDNDCDGLLPNNELDEDRDFVRVCAGDCDDSDPLVRPRRDEDCTNGIDDNCDGSIDESRDLDADGVNVCEGDCDDLDPQIAFGFPEDCDGVDDDCGCPGDTNNDGVVCGPGDEDVDEDFDFDQDGFVDEQVAACALVYDPNLLDCDDLRPEDNPDAAEVCGDGRDNDCDGVADINADTDNDGRGVCAGDCDDHNPLTYGPDTNAGLPAALELCDGQDNDCDGLVDDGLDGDSDGYLPCSGDCDDTNSEVFPLGIERCNGMDDDCTCPRTEAGDSNTDGTICGPGDGGVDEVFDADMDGYVDAENPDCLAGYLAEDLDCDDSDDSVHPQAPEPCDGVDNDCDGEVDEDSDLDQDGITACGGDCDDENPEVGPGQVEQCADGADNDCDGAVDADDPDCRAPLDLPPGFSCGASYGAKGAPSFLLLLLALMATRLRRSHQGMEPSEP